jgi:tetratricopeptide (TPR) repeat protein
MGKVSVATYEASLGRMGHSEEYCQAGIADLRALGERWGLALALAQLAELAETRGDHEASIAALAESAEIGRELGVWSDLTYVEARLALIRARAGDRERAHADYARVEQAIAARGGHVDTDHWVLFMRAELAWRDGDFAATARYCENLLALIAVNRARWWESLRAQVKARLGLAWLRQGDQARCRALLAEAIDAAASWWEHPSLAAAIDACAAYSLSAGGPDGAQAAARLLGAGHAVRGAFDESSLDAGPARAAATAALGTARFRAAYDSGRDLGYAAAAELARASVSATP